MQFVQYVLLCVVHYIKMTNDDNEWKLSVNFSPGKRMWKFHNRFMFVIVLWRKFNASFPIHTKTCQLFIIIRSEKHFEIFPYSIFQNKRLSFPRIWIFNAVQNIWQIAKCTPFWWWWKLMLFLSLHSHDGNHHRKVEIFYLNIPLRKSSYSLRKVDPLIERILHLLTIYIE